MVLTCKRFIHQSLTQLTPCCLLLKMWSVQKEGSAKKIFFSWKPHWSFPSWRASSSSLIISANVLSWNICLGCVVMHKYHCGYLKPLGTRLLLLLSLRNISSSPRSSYIMQFCVGLLQCVMWVVPLISPSVKWSFILDDGVFTIHSAFIQDSVISFLASINTALLLERKKLKAP